MNNQDNLIKEESKQLASNKKKQKNFTNVFKKATWTHSEKKFLEKLKENSPVFFSPKNSNFLPMKNSNLNTENSKLNHIMKKMKSVTQILEINQETLKNNKIQRILRYHIGLVHHNSSSIPSILPKKTIEKSRNSLSNLFLAKESVFNALNEKKKHIFKAHQQEKKSQSDLAKQRDSLVKQRDSLTQKLLTNLNKKFGKQKKSSNILDFFESRKKILTMYEKSENYPISIFHLKKFNDLRIIEDYKINTPKLCLHPVGFPCKISLKNIEFIDLFEYLQKNAMLGEINKENFATVFDCESEIINRIRVFVYNENTSIPYIILASQMNPKKKEKQILFVLHDFFDNFLEHLNYYKEIIQQTMNCKIILLNYPCQLFTIYNKKQFFNNEDIAKILDALIFSLENQKVLDFQRDSIKLLGLGYGGNIATYFASSCESAFQPLNSILVINSFVYIDEMFAEKIKLLLDVFDSNIGEELALDYYFQMTHTSLVNKDEIRMKLLKNPLENCTKKAIMKGCLNNVNCYLKIQKCEILIFVVHSLQNSFISVIHADVLNKMNFDLKEVYLQNASYENKIMMRGGEKRITAYIDGGHDIIEVKLFF